MANYIKGNVRFVPGVEQINRKWAIRKKTCSASKKVGPVETESNTWMGSGTRVAGRAGLGTMSKNYFVFRENARSSAVGADELQARGAFEAGVKWAVAALKDLMAFSDNLAVYNTMAANPAAYILLGDNESRLYAKGYTYPGFVRAFGIKQYTADPTSLPQNHKLPQPTIPA